MKKVAALAAVLVLAGASTYFFFGKARVVEQDTVHLRLESFALSLTPSKLSDTESRRIATLLHLGLVRVDQDGTVRPGIAGEWERSGLIARFSLKADTTFNDGSSLTADDVTASLCQSMQPASLYAWSLASIKHEKSVDGKSVLCTGITGSGSTVEIEESYAAPWLLEALSGPAGWITKKGALPGQYGDVPGAGAYRLVEVLPDSRVTLQSRSGAAVPANAKTVVFSYIADDAVAATRFKSGGLQVLELNSPNLIRSLGIASNKSIAGAELKVVPTDKLRIVMIGETQLIKKGWTTEQINSFKKVLSNQIDREKVTAASSGLASSHKFPYIVNVPPKDTSASFNVTGLPKMKLTVVSESDAFSDLIAASLPKTIGAVEIDYKGVDKGLLISSIVKQEFDLASVVIEATLKAPVFWTSFFNPTSPFVAFGKPLPGVETANLLNESTLSETLARISNEGNWIGVVRENKLLLSASNVTGLRFTPTGQTSYEEIGLK